MKDLRATTLTESAGANAVAVPTRFKGVVLHAGASGAVLTVRKDSATGQILAQLTSAAVVDYTFMLPGDCFVKCPLLIYYSLTDSSGTSTATLFDYAG